MVVQREWRISSDLRFAFHSLSSARPVRQPRSRSDSARLHHVSANPRRMVVHSEPDTCNPLPSTHVLSDRSCRTSTPRRTRVLHYCRAHVHSLADGAPLTLLTHLHVRHLASVNGCQAEVARSPAAMWTHRSALMSIVHTQVEKNNVSGESRGRSSSIVFEFRHRQIGGFTLLVLEKDQLNYASAKTTDSSTVIQNPDESLNFVFWSVYPYTHSIVHTQVEKNNVSGESRGRSSSIVFEFRHRQIGGFTLLVLEKDQLNYASAKTTDSSTVIQNPDESFLSTGRTWLEKKKWSNVHAPTHAREKNEGLIHGGSSVVSKQEVLPHPAVEGMLCPSSHHSPRVRGLHFGVLHPESNSFTVFQQFGGVHGAAAPAVQASNTSRPGPESQQMHAHTSCQQQ
ncbi:hypothetical protein LR48_Vigan11g107700 [Vigna angularis]|uniref:Uncharacterized protein n=1 Tax=Phaseolus angularis TaxID=3914 RepID=A0A0L9VTG9_PHAAN|nr:hypothetical protein LR48_Vigan11g107700 [Vigna angularis]